MKISCAESISSLGQVAVGTDRFQAGRPSGVVSKLDDDVLFAFKRPPNKGNLPKKGPPEVVSSGPFVF